jgi:GTP-binding protein EngB required for normal cell division
MDKHGGTGESSRTGQIDADQLIRRAEAVAAFTEVAAGIVAEDRLGLARTTAQRTVQRLGLSRDHTVAALAGATGSGKSSLFNALTGLALSEVGLLRPTTGDAHACVWGSAGAGPLLDWLDIAPARRFNRESALDADDQAALRGLVLLDLPDFDSLAAAHQAEVDRLLALVDLVIWVTDPQKYADQVIHERYLRTFHRHREVTVVVLNQADRLSPPDADRCLADLLRLLRADGLPEVPLLPTSAIAGQAGVAELRGQLEKAVAVRQAVLHRLGTDLDETADELSTVVGPAVRGLPQEAIDELTAAVAGATGVPAVVRAAADTYRVGAGRALGWPPARLFRRRRPDPLARLRLDQPQRPAAQLAVRDLGDRAGAGLPEPWRAAVAGAARARLPELPGALDDAVRGTDLGLRRTPVWWRLFNALQWLLLMAAVAAAGWLVAGLFEPRLSHDPIRPALAGAAALLAGPLLALLVSPLVAAGARRVSRRAARRLGWAMADVSGEYVLRPVREVLGRYADAHRALDTVRR